MRTQLPIRSITFLLLSVYTVISLASCEKSEINDKIDKALEVNLLKSAVKYNDVLAKRESGTDQSFSIEGLKREGDVLKISVKGGCSSDAFKIIWDGYIMFSYPGQVRLLLNHESKNSGCSTTDNFVVVVNLTKILGTHNPSGFIFHIANGSIKQDKSLNPNGVVSSN
ncbi:MAG: hypothetical protein Q8S11_10910 [Daejeonella sp.]|uniref:hypothetical protein n=1 Tax=Daejeonella sp. TaxID=2805397 RepID=UPI002734DF65|nr:hypothetical protein [Daejeonella sp.]MDP3468835.1 hypothetical protein [Daejeonella sp.]